MTIEERTSYWSKLAIVQDQPTSPHLYRYAFYDATLRYAITTHFTRKGLLSIQESLNEVIKSWTINYYCLEKHIDHSCYSNMSLRGLILNSK